MAGIKPYSKEQRVKAATNIFKTSLADILRRERIPDSYVPQDLAAVFLTNATGDIEELEKIVEEFTGDHKNKEFHDFQDSATKLLFVLDSIDVSDNSEARKGRYDLYTRLTELSETLENRIHPNHSECEKCIQIMAFEGRFDEIEFIVTVKNESLVLNPNALDLVSVPEPDTPIAIVSVIGQPKSRKTFMISHVLRYFREKALVAFRDDHATFPRALDAQNKFFQPDGREGVLIWKKPIWISKEDGQQLGVYFLDIWMSDESFNADVYSKLVDFCIYISSTVVFAEVAPVVQWVWRLETSLFSPLNEDKKVFQKLYILIQEWTSLRPEDYLAEFQKMSEEKDVDQSMANTFKVPRFVSQFFESWRVCFLPVSQQSFPQHQSQEAKNAETGYNQALTHFLQQLIHDWVPLKRGNNIVTEKTIINELKIALSISNDAGDALNFPFANSSDSSSPSGESKVLVGDGIEGDSLKELSNSFCFLQISDLNDNCDVGDSLSKDIEQEKSKSIVKTNGESMDMEIDDCKYVTLTSDQSGSEEENMLLNVSGRPHMEKIKPCERSPSSAGGEADLDLESIEVGIDASMTSMCNDDLKTTTVQGNPPFVMVPNHNVAGFNEEATIVSQDHSMKPGPHEKFEFVEVHFCHHTENTRSDVGPNESITVKENEEMFYGPGMTTNKTPSHYVSEAHSSAVEEETIERTYALAPEGECVSMKSRNQNVPNQTHDRFLNTAGSAYFPDQVKNNKTLQSPPLCKSEVLHNLSPVLQDARTHLADQQSLTSSGSRRLDSPPCQSARTGVHAETEAVVAMHPCVGLNESTKENQELQKNDVKQHDGSHCSRPIPRRAVLSAPANSDARVKSLEELKGSVGRTYHAMMKKYFPPVTDELGFCDPHLLKTTHLHVHERVLKEIQSKYAKIDSSAVKSIVAEKVDEEFSLIEDKNLSKVKSYEGVVEVTNTRMSNLFLKIEAKLLAQISLESRNYSVSFPDIQPLIKEVTRSLPFRWQQHFRNIIIKQRDQYILQLKLLYNVVATYEKQLVATMNSAVCLPVAELSHIQVKALQYAETSNDFHQPKRALLQDAYQKSITKITGDFSDLNEATYQSEEKAAKDVATAALSHYQSFMEDKISHALLTDKCVETFHRICMSSVGKAFSNIGNPEFQVTHPWKVQQIELQKKLETQLIVCKKMNREHLQKMAKLHKKLLLDCETKYHETMTGQQNHNESLACALKILEENTSKFSTALRNAWTKEISSRLESCGQVYMTENNAKNNPTVAPELPGRASENQQEAPLKTPYGIGIYLAHEEIRVGVHSSHSSQTSAYEFRFLPLIAFTSEGVLISDDAKCHRQCLDVHHLLEGTEKADKSSIIYGKYVPLKVEDVVAVYFHGLKLQMERKIRHRIESCVVAISGLLTSRAKQLLKTSLCLAGFKRSVLLPNTTAMALSYAIQREMDGKEKSFYPDILVVYQAGDTVEAARAHISLTNVKIKRISGFQSTKGMSKWTFRQLVSNEDELQRKVKHVLKDVLNNKVVKQAVVVSDRICGHNENVAAYVRKKLDEFEIRETRMNEHLDIISLCAVLDASQNPNFEGQRAVFPGYVNALPYSISFEVNDDGPNSIMHQNDELFDDFNLNFRMDCNLLGTCIVTERFMLHEKENDVDKCNFRYHQSKTEVSVTIRINSEGCCWIVAGIPENPNAIVKLMTASAFMIPSERHTSMVAIRDILMREEEKNSQAGPKLGRPLHSQGEKHTSKQKEKPSESSSSSMTPSPVVPDTISESMQKLSRLVEDVKMKVMADNGATNSMVIEKINATVQQCEELLGKPGVKSKQLELKFKVLETHAAKIVLTK